MNRDLAIDATRGVAIWSMITAHFATGTPLAWPTHAFPYVDGMSVFVLLSGFVLGLVHQRWTAREGLRYAYWRLLKRIVVLYLCQFAIAVVAVAAAVTHHRWLTRLPRVKGWKQGIELALTMDYLPSGGNILLLYLVLMLMACGVLVLLHYGWWCPVLIASLALYAVSQLAAPDWFYLTRYPTGGHSENWAAWQFVFIPAMVLGWRWNRWRGASFVDRWLGPIIAAAIVVALAFHFIIDTGPLAHLEPDLADKINFAPARAVGAPIAVAAVYGAFRAIGRRSRHNWLRPLVMTGGRSLDSYVLQATALVVIPINVAHRPWAPVTCGAVTLLVFLSCWGWAELRAQAGIDKLHRVPLIIVRSLPWARPSLSIGSASQSPPPTPPTTGEHR
ncbi:MAG: OpgC domain-containing protein [Gordonia sp. (in: high G+C Gram-positive bacteria)]